MAPSQKKGIDLLGLFSELPVCLQQYKRRSAFLFPFQTAMLTILARIHTHIRSATTAPRSLSKLSSHFEVEFYALHDAALVANLSVEVNLAPSRGVEPPLGILASVHRSIDVGHAPSASHQLLFGRSGVTQLLHELAEREFHFGISSSVAHGRCLLLFSGKRARVFLVWFFESLGEKYERDVAEMQLFFYFLNFPK